MLPLRNSVKSRSSQLEEYFRRNCKTTAEVVDFIGGLTYVRFSDSPCATQEENDKGGKLYEDYLLPWKQTVVGDKLHEVLDTEKMEQRMGEFADYAILLQTELAKEFKKQLALVPKKIDKADDRNKRAMFKTRASEAYYKYNWIVNRTMLLILHGSGRYDSINQKNDYMDKFNEVMASKNREYLETLSEDEKKYHRMAMDASLFEPELLKDVEPGDVGLSEKKLDAMTEKSKRKLLERADFNWVSDKTMTAIPKFLSEQLSSDINKRYGRYYMSLEKEEDKNKFILDGMLEKGNLKIYQEGKVPVSLDCLSKKEKQFFKRACDVHFSPIKADGSPDKDLFVKRIDAMVEEMARLRMEHAKFIQNKDNFKDIIKDSDNLEKRKKVATYISPYYKKLGAYESEMFDILGRKNVNKDLKIYYIEKKTGEQFVEANALDAKGNPMGVVYDKIQDVFNNEIEKKVESIFNENELGQELIGDGEGTVLSDKEMASVRKRSNSETLKIMEEHRSNKPWLNTGKDINMDSLKMMNNLYEQFKNEDRIIYINSEEYTELKKKLKVAADMYKEVSKRKKPEMSSVEKVEMESAFDAIHDAALKYIDGKEEKARKSDHGQNRYEIAFAALGIAYKGVANRRIAKHNVKHILNSNKTLSINDLMERGKRTVKEQKAYEKTHKPREKQQERRSSLASIKI